MPVIFKTTNYPVKILISNIKYGKIALPDIQRPFVWKTKQVRDLFDSIYKGFPTGYLLFWSTSNEDNIKEIGVDHKEHGYDSLIIDGQQRLTALYATMMGIPVIDEDYKKRKIVIAFNPITETFEVNNAAIEKNIEYISDISSLFKDGFKEYTFINNYISLLRENRSVSEEEASRIADNISRLVSILEYNFIILEISSEIDEETAANIFVRVNSGGVVLKQSDFVMTLLSVFWQDGRKKIEEFCKETRNKPEEGEVSAFNHIVDASPDEILRSIVGYGFGRGRMRDVYSLLRGRNFETREFIKDLQIERIEKLKQFTEEALNNSTWHDYVSIIQSSLGFKSKDLITSNTNFFYGYAFYLIGKYKYNTDYRELEKIIKKWFLFGAITRRYSGSSETVFNGDLADIRNVSNGEEFIKALENIINSNLTDDYWEITIPSNLQSSSARNPLLLIFTAAQIKNNINVLFSDKKISDLFDPIVTPKKKRLEKHHIFPKGYLNSIGIADQTKQNQVANMVYLEYKDNIHISDKPPKEYFPKIIESLGGEIEYSFYSHAIPESIEDLTYEDFLEKRRKLIADYIKIYFKEI
jgi:hypothetical protein